MLHKQPYEPTTADEAWAADIMTRPVDALRELAHVEDEVREAVSALRHMATWIETTRPYLVDLEYANPEDKTMRWISVGFSHPCRRRLPHAPLGQVGEGGVDVALSDGPRPARRL